MMRTVFATVRNGRIEPCEEIRLAEGSQLLLTVLDGEDERSFWLEAGDPALVRVWENPDDDVYAELLEG